MGNLVESTSVLACFKGNDNKNDDTDDCENDEKTVIVMW